MQAIQKEISKMPEELKLVFIPFVKGLTYEEISQETNVTLATVRARVHRAKQILRNNENLENLASF
jgi:DNA-directed RNA polymerase specialized sigma24 family protein